MPENFHARYGVSPDAHWGAAQEPPGLRWLATELPAVNVEVDEGKAAVTDLSSQDP